LISESLVGIFKNKNIIWLIWTYEEVVGLVISEILNDRLPFLIDFVLVLIELKIVFNDVYVRCLKKSAYFSDVGRSDFAIGV
jgi:hypothetical protein